MTSLISTALPDEPTNVLTIEDIDGRLVCREIRDETHDVKSFVLQHEWPVRYAFEPGQHLTVTVDVAGEQLSRCYTISSSPAESDSVTITVKRVPGGPVSNWLHDHLSLGGTVHVSGPLGTFTRDPAASRLLLLTAGSGITPAMSMLRDLRDRGAADDVLFVHCARTPADLIFRDELLRTEAALPGVRLVFVCETDAINERWRGPRGRLTLDLLRAVAPDAGAREVYSCGPAPFMDAVREHLGALGVDPFRTHEESFVLEETSSAPTFPASGTTTHQVELRRSGVTLSCDSATPILQAAAAAGITLPSSCAEGVCGTCKSQLLSGTVEMNHQGGIRPREIVQDKILPCCSTPTSDVVLDV